MASQVSNATNDAPSTNGAISTNDANTTATANKSSVFNAEDILKAFEQGKEGIVVFDWDNPRSGPNGCKYIPVYFDLGEGQRPAIFRFKDEKHVGQICPHEQEDLARLNLASGQKDKYKKRDRNPCLQIQKWCVPVLTQMDGITLKTDKDGNPELPSPDKLSTLFKVIQELDSAFENEVEACLTSGKICARNLRRRTAPAEGALVVSNTKIHTLVQRTISMEASKNAGCALSNPIARLRMKCNMQTGVPNCLFFDKSRPFSVGSRTSYEALVDANSNQVNASNISNMILPGSIHDGVCDASSVCTSGLGISYLLDAAVLVVTQPLPTKTRATLEDVYE